MAITLTGAQGIFSRLGKVFFAIKSANLYLGSTDISAGGLKAVGVSVGDIVGQFTSTDLQVPFDGGGLYGQRDSARVSLASWKTYLKSLAEDVLVTQVDRDVTLVDKSVAGALRELITQMIGSGTIYNADNDVDAGTTSATVTALTTNTGTGVLACSVVRADGRANELVLPETLEAVCTSDATSGAVARSESFGVRGEPVNSDPLSFNWPGGSGVTVPLTAVDASIDETLNLLKNSDFEDFTSNVPDSWSVLVGAAGTDIGSDASVVYRTGKALKFTGASGVLSSIVQVFGTDNGSALKPNTVYAVNFFAKDSGAGLLAGVVAVSLLDGSNTVVNDAAGTANTVSVAFGTTTGTYASVKGFFRTPRVLPSTVKICVRVTTGLTDGESMYIDDLALVEAVELYTGGPYAALFAGATDFLAGDQINAVIANNAAGDLQTYCDRVFDLRGKGLQLPSDAGGTETIADTLMG